MKKKESRFHIEYGKSNNCSDCKYCNQNPYPYGRFSNIRHLVYCVKCSMSSNKKGFAHK